MIVKIEKARYSDVLRATDVFGNVYYGKTPDKATRYFLGEDEVEATCWETARSSRVEGRALEALRTAHALYLAGDGDADTWHSDFSSMFKEHDGND